MYAVVDIETTGNFTGRHKITEIAIYIFDGEKIIDEYQTLINPESSIPPYISSMTGITNKMVENAPKFYEVAKEIFLKLDGNIFVAHNVNFDYNFIRQEFKSLGGDFQSRKLCTVRLSRKILPGLPSYSLGNLANHLGIKINGRHRAYGDAKATVQVLQHLLKNDMDDHILKALKKNSHEATLPPNLSKDQFTDLPEKTGVYYFYDQRGKAIYVGKAKNIKSRIRSHFSAGSETTQKQNLFREIFDVSYELCGNELIALLYEAHEIKRLWPQYNRAQKRISWNFGIYTYEDQKGYKRFSISKINTSSSEPFLVFRNQMEARSFLNRLVIEYELCPKLCGIQKSPTSCFDYQIKKCHGACVGEEKPGKYNKRYNQAFNAHRKLNDSIAIIGEGRTKEESSVVWIENGKYLGFGYFDNTLDLVNVLQLKSFIHLYDDDQDIQRIIRMYLRNHKDYRIVPIE
jgi:DNA polymerase-3 subunit epsilon